MSAIVKAESAAIVHPFAPTDFAGAWQLAKIVVQSGMAPGLRTPEQAFVCLATGAELGLSAMQSIRSIHVVEGRPCLSADLLVAVCKRAAICEYFREVETSDLCSTWETKRADEESSQIYRFSMAEAKKAGLDSRPNWRKYPRRMLAARAKAYLARDTYPELVLGLYTADEIQGSVDEKPQLRPLAKCGSMQALHVVEPEADDGRLLAEALEALDECQDEACLRHVATNRADGLSEESKSILRDAYKRALARVRAQSQAKPMAEATEAPEREPGDDTEEIEREKVNFVPYVTPPRRIHHDEL